MSSIKSHRGEYESVDALIEEALQYFIDDDTSRDEVRARIDAAEADIGRGEFVEYDESNIHELAREIRERGLKRLAAERATQPRNSFEVA